MRPWSSSRPVWRGWWPVIAELALRFLVIGALAFGGGQAALPLVERLAVGDTGWLTSSQFAVGVGLAYATPGPVLILAAYVGYLVAGIAGAVVATAAVFAVPITLAASAAAVVERLEGSERFRRFGAGAAAGAVGLLGVTLLVLARPVGVVSPLLLVGSSVVFLASRRFSPVVILLVAVVAGGAVAGITAAR